MGLFCVGFAAETHDEVFYQEVVRVFTATDGLPASGVDKIIFTDEKIPVAVITGWNVELEESEMKERGVNFIAHKPFEVNQILTLVQQGMELRKRLEAA